MVRILALDVGEKTIGVAVSDENEAFAFPRQTIVRQEGYRRDMAALKQIVADEGIGEVVVGLPLMMDGSRGVQAAKIEEFAATLRRYTAVPIHLQDERLSTSEAEGALLAAHSPGKLGARERTRRPAPSRDQRKQTVDSIAASVILQSYLARKRAAGR